MGDGLALRAQLPLGAAAVVLVKHGAGQLLGVPKLLRQAAVLALRAALADDQQRLAAVEGS